MTLARFFACIVVCAVVVATARAEFKASAAVRVITPDPLLPVSGGMGAPSPTRETRGELCVRAFTFENNGTRVAIVQVDALGFPSILCHRVREKVEGIPAKNILIGATHTHSAPDFYAFPDGKGGHTADLNYIDSVCTKAAEAINEAIDHLKPARIRIASGEAHGKIAYNYYAPDLYDRRASIIQAVADDDSTIVTLVNYAIHPEVLGAEVGILSPDLIGPLCERIESKVGGIALFMNGAQGGMVTADNRDLSQPSDASRAVWKDGRVWDECIRIGNLLADESLRIVSTAKIQREPAVECFSKDVRFPVESDNLWSVVKYSPLHYPHNDDRSVTTQINVVNLGDSQILTIPGEALPNIGFYLKRKMYGRNNLLFGLTNDAFGYILTKVDFKSFERYDYISRVSLGEMTGEIFIREALQLVDECPRPQQNEK